MIPALTASNLLAYVAQVAAIVLIGSAGIQLLRVQSPRVRVALYRLLLVGCVVLPFVSAATSPQRPPVVSTAAENALRSSAAVDVHGVSRDSNGSAGARDERQGSEPAFAPLRFDALVAYWPLALSVLLVAGMIARLAWLLVGTFALKRLRSKAVYAEDFRPIERASELVGAAAEFRTSEKVRAPVTFGAFRPIVLLPTSFSELEESEQTAIACHELLHVRRHDWLQTVAEETVRAVLWFHPAIWWLLAQLDLSREQVVDAEVVTLVRCRQPYVNALVRLATAPPGPALRPASLFLGRAHLLKRVALLSREVRMSRWRIALSVVLVVIVLGLGGRAVVNALPLSPMVTAESAGAALPSVAPRPLASPVPRQTATPGPPPLPGPAPAGVALAPQEVVMPAKSPVQAAPRVIIRVEPTYAFQNSENGMIVVMEVVVGLSGSVEGPVDARFIDDSQKLIGSVHLPDVNASPQPTFSQPHNAEVDVRLRAALDAVRAWRFEPPSAPVNTIIGFNFARTDQSGPAIEALPVGGNVQAPARVLNVMPVYPQAAQNSGTQGVVILQLVIDSAGIPTTAYAIRPINGLTTAAATAALKWRFAPDASIPRRLMTVTVNFTLDSTPKPTRTSELQETVVVSGIPPVPPPLPPPGMNTLTMRQETSFGLPSNQWPSSALTVDEGSAPRRTAYVAPVYPKEALAGRVAGTVILDALIGEDGTVIAGQVRRSIPMLDAAALDAVRQWKYTPTLVNGVPVPVRMMVTVRFTLD